MVDSLPFRAKGGNEKVREQERGRPGHGETDQLRTEWKTRSADDNCAPQGLTTKLAEARGGELHAATALRNMRLTLERTLMVSEADALNATTANEEWIRLRRTLRKLSGETSAKEAGTPAPE